MRLTKTEKKILKTLNIPYKGSTNLVKDILRERNISLQQYQTELKQRAKKTKEQTLKQDEKAVRNRQRVRKFRYLRSDKLSKIRDLTTRLMMANRIQKTFIRNRLLKMRPSDGALKSYFNYKIIIRESLISPFPTFKEILNYYKVREFLTNQLQKFTSFKAYISFELMKNDDNNRFTGGFSSTAIRILHPSDIDKVFQSIMCY
jgi:hypothetical protein